MTLKQHFGKKIMELEYEKRSVQASLYLEIQSSPTSIATSNAKTTFHSVSRNGHLRLAKDPYEQPPAISPRNARKQQTALHKAAYGHNLDSVCVDEGIDGLAEFFGVVKALGAHSDFIGLMHAHC
ncbi:hypothetical protein CTI12_AA395430 [Artemisia annua]|uniref:Uncharacterized protein n=1 Tax=Artemisia annua TaxID=35608 RepID=A0A2U1MCG4_ARTAN|nr:hypothetical protein CTI12_AA395430 [Artemisia annua]